METQASKIKAYLIKHAPQHPTDIVAVTTKRFSVTRTTVHRHLNTLCKSGEIIKSGTTRNIKYHLSSDLNRELSYKITPKLSEFSVLQDDFDAIFLTLPKNIYDICQYGFTEIFNNAIDHSQGTTIKASLSYKNHAIKISISDNGIGIFKNISDYFQLEDIRESMLQLNKGKTTSDPANHTGEGIFFSSKAFDIFEIYANKLYFIYNNLENDWSFEQCPEAKTGSNVCMTILDTSTTNLVSIFKQHQEPESLAFNRTKIIVALSKLKSETLMSRSQAKRIILGLEKFDHVTLDFLAVRLVGQGFVDELFRVFSNAHPHVTIDFINANEDIEYMIKRGLATAKKHH